MEGRSCVIFQEGFNQFWKAGKGQSHMNIFWVSSKGGGGRGIKLPPQTGPGQRARGGGGGGGVLNHMEGCVVHIQH